MRPRAALTSDSGAIVTFFFSAFISNREAGGGISWLFFRSTALSKEEGGSGQGTVSGLPVLKLFWTSLDGAPAWDTFCLFLLCLVTRIDLDMGKGLDRGFGTPATGVGSNDLAGDFTPATDARRFCCAFVPAFGRAAGFVLGAGGVRGFCRTV